VGLPYGRYPRLVLAYLNTEAVRRKSREIELGPHFSHFCATLGIPPTTGPRGSLPMLRDQMQRLFASTLQCVFHDENEGRHAGDGFLVADKRELWWDPRPGKGEAAWGSHGVLSDGFSPLARWCATRIVGDEGQPDSVDCGADHQLDVVDDQRPVDRHSE
jgi:hypothetical protein